MAYVRLPAERYKCLDRGKIERLVIRRSVAVRCVSCDYAHLVKLRTLWKLNKYAGECLYGL